MGVGHRGFMGTTFQRSSPLHICTHLSLDYHWCTSVLILVQEVAGRVFHPLHIRKVPPAPSPHQKSLLYHRLRQRRVSQYVNT